MGPSHCIEFGDGGVERLGVSERLVGQVIGFEIVPDDLDVIELRGVFGQPP
jgi:hypothetical protein